MKIYDRMRWYVGDNEVFLVSARRMNVLMKWLKTHGLLSVDGLEIYAAGIDEDFGIDEVMLTEAGNRLLALYYVTWLDVVDPVTPDPSYFEQYLDR